MPILNSIAEFAAEMTAWCHHLHAHPELSYQEHEAAAFIAGKLRDFGIAVTEGVGGTGVVNVLDGAKGDGPTIGLRADMDALAIEEKNDFSHRSTRPGVMHACGHDGHVAMLLGAAKHLASDRSFAGRVVFNFQPAEEMGGEEKTVAFWAE